MKFLGVFVIVLATWAFAAAPDAGLNLTAKLANVSGAPADAKIEILRWSTEEERAQLLNAWELRAAAPTSTKGKAAAKGKSTGRGEAPPPALTPEASLTAALDGAATVGYLWATEVSGYAIRYAGRTQAADGSQRIVLITQRRLGAMNHAWDPSAGEANKHPFSVIELRLDAKNAGEGRASLTGKLAVDSAVKIVTPDAAAPVVFREVKGK